MFRNTAVFCLFFSLAGPLSAQLASTTSLVGNVTDPGGANMAGAEVTALNEGTQEVLTTRTSSEGAYEFQFIKSGTYDITVRQGGFETFTKRGVFVATNQTVRTDFVMKVGQVSERMEVTAEVPPIATDDAVLSETIDTRRTQELP